MDIKLMPEKYKQKGIGGDLEKLPGTGRFKVFDRLAFKDGLWFALSIVLLIIIVLSCFGLWGYKISLSKEMDSLSQESRELQSQRNLELEASFTELKGKVESFKSILTKRVYFLNTLKMIEELTLAQVQYIDFSVDLKTAAINLTIQATNYNTLAKQIVVFEDDPRIKEVGLSEVSLEKSGWVGSKLNLELDSSFLYSD